MESQFEWPWLLFLIPAWFIILLLPKAKGQRTAVYFPFLEAMKSNKTIAAASIWPWRLAQFCIWLLLCLAIARPQLVGDALPDTKLARNLVLALDVSESMSTRDMQVDLSVVDRLAAAKNVLASFIKRRAGDQLGLVLFGSNAYIQAPLTFDSNTVQELLKETQIGIAGQKTAIGDALLLSIKLIENTEKAQADNSSIILLSDGSNTSGRVSPQVASQLAQEKNIRIYTIGLGNKRFRNDVDEPALRAIASSTKGEYFRAQNTAQLSAIYDKLDKLNKVETKKHSYRPISEVYYLPLAAALALFTLLLIIKIVPQLVANIYRKNP